jgi:hypothetical protein
MPESARLFTFSSTAAYRAAFKRLAKAMKAEGWKDDPISVAESAIAEAAGRRNITMPARTAGIGGKRAGAGRRPKAKPRAEK